MGFLDNLLGGGTQQRSEYEDFVRRYEQGPPSEGYSDQEVYDRYTQVTRDVPSDVYEQSAEEAFARLSPQERREFARFMQQRARQSNYDYPDLNRPDADDYFQDPHSLAQMTSQMRQRDPGILDQLLGGGSGGGQSDLLSNPLAKAAMAGIAAMAVKRMMGGR